MNYHHTLVETPAVVLPPMVLSSEELEERLAPTYSRIGLQIGRLELMTGIRQRRFWPKGMLPSQGAALAGQKALEQSGIPPEDIDCIVNCSVSRDCVEPATATFVHHALGLSPAAVNFDISNACLGMASGIMTLAAMVEAGAIRTGLAVACENAGPLVENTVRTLNDGDFTRKTIKPHFASLTIGSCASAVIVRRADDSGTPAHRLLASVTRADTASNTLCQGNANGGMTDGSAPLMQTDSPELLQRGVALAAAMWAEFKAQTGWTEDTPRLVCTHQVGKGHRALLYDTLRLDVAKDYSTFPILGNCGSVSLPATLALAAQARRLNAGDDVALLGIGSGINCCGLALEW